MKMHSNLGIEGNYLNLINSIYKIIKSHTILNSRRLNAFPLRLGTSQGCLHSPMLSSIEMEVLANIIKKEKGNARHTDQKEDIKPSICRYIVYIENPKTATKNS